MGSEVSYWADKTLKTKEGVAITFDFTGWDMALFAVLPCIFFLFPRRVQIYKDPIRAKAARPVDVTLIE